MDDAVLTVFVSLPRRQREQLLRVFDSLAADPFMRGDTIQKDDAARPYDVKRFGDWTVIYWSEHIAKKVHIVAVEHLKL